MNYASVIRVLAGLMSVLAAGGLLPAALAALRGENQQVFAFITMSVAVIVVASTILLLTPKPSRKARPSDGLAVIILFWIFAPIAASFPFLIGVANASPLSAIHEAMSCLTTTGHTVIAISADGWPSSLVMWRGVLHLLGAFVTIITAVSVFAALNLGGPGIHRTVLFTIPEDSFFNTTPRVVWNVLVLMLAGLFAILVLQIFAGVPLQRSLDEAVSVITTGLVHPAAATRAVWSPVSAIILGFGLVIGALGIAILLPLKNRQWTQTLFDPENVTFVLMLGVFSVAIMLWGVSLLDAFGLSLSSLSTSGLSLSDPATRTEIPLSLIVLPALIGGSALSAAGGVKLARFVILWRRAWQEFRQLGYRGSVVTFKFRQRELNERSVIGVWVYLIGYIVAVFGCVAGFAFFGQPFDDSVRLAVGSLTNSGALIGDVGSRFDSGESALLVIAMLLGRLEVLALLPALAPNFWAK